MPPISVEFRRGSPDDTSADTRVVALFEGDSPSDPAVRDLAESGEARPALRKVAVTHEGGRRLIVVGLGSRDEFDPERVRVAAAAAAGRAGELGARALSWAVPDGALEADPGATAGALVEGTLLSLYRFDSGVQKQCSIVRLRDVVGYLDDSAAVRSDRGVGILRRWCSSEEYT